MLLNKKMARNYQKIKTIIETCWLPLLKPFTKFTRILLNLYCLDVIWRISIHHNKLKMIVNFSLETNHNNRKDCYNPFFVNLLNEKCNSVCMKKWRWTSTSSKVSTTINVITFNETSKFPISNFACVYIIFFSIFKCFPFINLSRWKFVKIPLIIIMTIINPSKFVTSACKYD